MEGTGTLRAAERRGVFAPENGTVRQVLVTHGQRVHSGQTLAVIENTDLQVQRQQAAEELIAAIEWVKLKEAERLERGLSPVRHVQLDGELAELRQRIVHLEHRVELLDGRLAPLTLKAPMDGLVVTWDPDKQLLNRPVSTGQLLLQVIADDGPWQMELQVPEGHAGYVLRAWRDSAADAPPVVDYQLATHPEQRFRARLKDVSPRTEFIDHQHVVYVTAVPEAGSEPPLRDGAEVRGKIHCGGRSVGFVLFREIAEFIQRRVLFLF
jgi:multidrug efflux pump subunit AcrA (membrane-fusion protein)